MAIFRCTSFYLSTWFVLKDTLEKIGKTVDTHIINRAGLSDAGIYYCYGLNIHDKQHFLARSSLKVYGEFTNN